jgi:pSer/pThr/pTyr-binding forkhead associated (FHA) protein
MRLEVLIENEDPVVYPLGNQKITIGSSDNCEIVLSTEGVSRKHLSITSEGDNFFVVDLGSSNGSFINEERLIPGKRAEFTSFFPVRLGQNVLLSLLSDEEAESEGLLEVPLSFKEKPVEAQADVARDQTRIINLNDLSKQTTEKLISTRNEKRVELKAKSPKAAPQKKRSKFFSYLAFLILIGGAAYNFYKLKDNRIDTQGLGKISNPSPSKNDPIKTQDIPQNELKVNSDLVPEEDLVKRTSYESLINDIKCTTDEEKFLCLYFPGSTERPFGVIQVGLTFNILADGSVFIDHAKKVVKKPTDENPEVLEEYQKLVYETAAYIYLLRATAANPLDLSKYKEMRLSIALYDKSETDLKLAIVVAIKPDVFNRLKDVLFESNLDLIKTNGPSALEFVKKLYITY